MGARESAAAKSAVTHARHRRVDVKEAAAILDGENTEKRDLSSPALQYKIENPETMSITLDLSELGHGDREIVVKTAFSYADINDRKVVADLESYSALLVFEMSRHGVGVGDGKWREHSNLYLDIVAMESMLREKANAILAKISTYKETWKTSEAQNGGTVETIHRTPTLDELWIGIEGRAAAAVAAFLMVRVGKLREEHAARKKAQVAVA